jgi:hypothetical protein
MRFAVGPHLIIRRRLRKAWQYLASYYPSRQQAELFVQVRTFCLFIGYPRSGHTLVGSLVDAHPNALIANELNMVGHVKRGFSRLQIYALILANSRRFARAGWKWMGYSYAVPNQWQGRFERLEVLGDKRGPGVIRLLRANPGLLGRVRETLDTDLRFIHVIRNPFDNITTMSLRHRLPLESAVAYYFALCQGVAELKSQLRPDAMLDVWHERLVERPADEITRLCGFLDLVPHPDYVRDCASVVFPAPTHTRSRIVWPPDVVGEVTARAQAFPWLAGYTFAS